MSVPCFNTYIFTEESTTRLSAIPSSNVCPKCGYIKKSGKLSCCAHGGAWFKNCGDVGDRKVNHTWIEGVKSCKDFLSSASVESSLQAMFHNVKVNPHLLNNTKSEDGEDERITMYRLSGVSYSNIDDFKGCVGLAQMLVSMSILFII